MYTLEELQQLKRSKLQKLCKKNKLKAIGRNPQMIKRLNKYYSSLDASNSDCLEGNEENYSNNFETPERNNKNVHKNQNKTSNDETPERNIENSEEFISCDSSFSYEEKTKRKFVKRVSVLPVDEETSELLMDEMEIDSSLKEKSIEEKELTFQSGNDETPVKLISICEDEDLESTFDFPITQTPHRKGQTNKRKTIGKRKSVFDLSESSDDQLSDSEIKLDIYHSDLLSNSNVSQQDIEKSDKTERFSSNESSIDSQSQENTIPLESEQENSSELEFDQSLSDIQASPASFVANKIRENSFCLEEDFSSPQKFDKTESKKKESLVLSTTGKSTTIPPFNWKETSENKLLNESSEALLDTSTQDDLFSESKQNKNEGIFKNKEESENNSSIDLSESEENIFSVQKQVDDSEKDEILEDENSECYETKETTVPESHFPSAEEETLENEEVDFTTEKQEKIEETFEEKVQESENFYLEEKQEIKEEEGEGGEDGEGEEEGGEVPREIPPTDENLEQIREFHQENEEENKENDEENEKEVENHNEALTFVEEDFPGVPPEEEPQENTKEFEVEAKHEDCENQATLQALEQEREEIFIEKEFAAPKTFAASSLDNCEIPENEFENSSSDEQEEVENKENQFEGGETIFCDKNQEETQIFEEQETLQDAETFEEENDAVFDEKSLEEEMVHSEENSMENENLEENFVNENDGEAVEFEEEVFETKEELSEPEEEILENSPMEEKSSYLEEVENNPRNLQNLESESSKEQEETKEENEESDSVEEMKEILIEMESATDHPLEQGVETVQIQGEAATAVPPTTTDENESPSKEKADENSESEIEFREPAEFFSNDFENEMEGETKEEQEEPLIIAVSPATNKSKISAIRSKNEQLKNQSGKISKEMMGDVLALISSKPSSSTIKVTSSTKSVTTAKTVSKKLPISATKLIPTTSKSTSKQVVPEKKKGTPPTATSSSAKVQPPAKAKTATNLGSAKIVPKVPNTQRPTKPPPPAVQKINTATTVGKSIPIKQVTKPTTQPVQKTAPKSMVATTKPTTKLNVASKPAVTSKITVKTTASTTTNKVSTKTTNLSAKVVPNNVTQQTNENKPNVRTTNKAVPRVATKPATSTRANVPAETSSKLSKTALTKAVEKPTIKTAAKPATVPSRTRVVAK